MANEWNLNMLRHWTKEYRRLEAERETAYSAGQLGVAAELRWRRDQAASHVVDWAQIVVAAAQLGSCSL